MEKKVLDSKVIVTKSLATFTNEFLSELETEKKCRKRKAMARKVLLVFLGNYDSCIVDEKTKSICKEIMYHFTSSINDIERNERLDPAIQELVGSMSSAMKGIEDKETDIRPIIFKLICLYAGLTISDFEGAIKCHDLGKKLSSNWKKYTPINVTLSCLRKREKNSKLPISELALLEKYSF